MLMFFCYILVFMVPSPDYHLWAWHAGPLTGVKIMGIVCLLGAIVVLATSGRQPPFLRLASGRLFLILITVAILSNLLRHGVTFGAGMLPNNLAVLSLFFVTLVFVNSAERLRKAVLIVIGSVGFSSIYVIRQWHAGRGLYAGFRGFGGLAGDPNYYAISVVLCLPVTLFWVVSKRPRWERLLCLGCLVLMLGASSMSASRGGLLGLAAAMLVLAASSRHRARDFAVLVVVGAILVLSGRGPAHRLLHPNKSDKLSSEDRIELWQYGLRTFDQHPIFGVGFNGFHPMAWRGGGLVHLKFVVAHNTYIDYLADLGLAGFLPFLGVLIASGLVLRRQARRIRKSGGPPMLYEITRGLEAGVLGYMVSAFFLSTYWQQVVWLILFLSMCLPFVGTAAERPRIHAMAIQSGVSDKAEKCAPGW